MSISGHLVRDGPNYLLLVVCFHRTKRLDIKEDKRVENRHSKSPVLSEEYISTSDHIQVMESQQEIITKEDQ